MMFHIHFASGGQDMIPGDGFELDNEGHMMIIMPHEGKLARMGISQDAHVDVYFDEGTPFREFDVKATPVPQPRPPMENTP